MEITKERRDFLKNLMAEAAGPMVAELVEAKLADLAEAQKKTGLDGMEALVRRLEQKVDTQGIRKEKPGLTAAQMAFCVARAKLLGGNPADHARSCYGKEAPVASAFEKAFASDRFKAMQADDFNQGGALVMDTYAQEIIDALQAQAVVRSLGADVVPNPTGTLHFRKITSAGSASWYGEGENITKTEHSTGIVTATAKSLGATVPISNKLLRYADPRTDESIRRHLVRELRAKEDLAFIRSPGTTATPKGLRYWAAAANVTASEAGHDPASIALADTTKDLGQMMQQLMDADIPLFEGMAGWIIEPRTWQYLITARDGNGNLVYKDEMDSGTLFGFPFRVSSQIPRNLDASGSAGNDETEIIFADFSHVVIADSLDIQIRAFDGGAYYDGSTVQSGVSLDETVIRAIMETDMVARHAEGIAVKTQVVWGG